MKKGFTMAELVIVITIIIVLSVAALGGLGSVQRSMRLTNSFNKILLMVQQARSMAVTEKDTTLKNYEVEFNSNVNAPDSVIVRGNTKDNSPAKEIERYILDQSIKLKLISENNACTPKAIVRFVSGNATTQLTCLGIGSDAVVMLKLGIQEVAQGNAQAQSKTFSIHNASGIPQVN